MTANSPPTSTIKLTEYSHGAGCGCKISPQLLEDILKTQLTLTPHPKLLVGNSTKDDAAAYDLGDGTSVLSTTDFFMPIVDDPFTFGQIAATNAISDIYAMGGKPLMAIAILGWPIDTLSAEIAQQVIDGGRATCEAAGIPLAGGHSIDAPEPIFGLAVTGLVENQFLKRNASAEPNGTLFLTKPLGIGILTTAQKQKKLQPEHLNTAIDAMTTLNQIGHDLAKLDGVTALTDITGFGLLGHLIELCEGSEIAAQIQYDKLPLLPHVLDYLSQGCTPGGSERNFASYGHKVSPLRDNTQKMILCDPQTSGGLLAVVRNDAIPEFQALATAQGLTLQAIGTTHPKSSQSHCVEVI
ncbi:MAG: selenide, water dikinase SelD [Piscirickettsiaceae bacterium CG_4_9_14_3_um_filter_43_564]|nr:selenide, water dikinase SelD [Thiomicrospira sp.]OIP94883.1 MAG: selenide, water dikinase SelD [Thiomicrospira sp. CG2_30_44_34]PIQ05915.1 MAG: selenide, water dikinase SelD [Piscirickettsiaceae bacterium CG18_big_fil_WC_8_21_14_2_50_44_103]PIU37684.1 MAG: selenide, water dikinase SelD [Piscirickettsiaceae bacterium CG07_land_8_20_14_0_80_44_28]PIW57279.1 MAG: selenide, water dikinase SelD [Piscirickettsiaceae bacterium CG12_big_fil_rev_8_21_14_0_65_44_934]PIW77060.1 MAG: selenide, water d